MVYIVRETWKNTYCEIITEFSPYGSLVSIPDGCGKIGSVIYIFLINTFMLLSIYS